MKQKLLPECVKRSEEAMSEKEGRSAVVLEIKSSGSGGSRRQCVTQDHSHEASTGVSRSDAPLTVTQEQAA